MPSIKPFDAELLVQAAKETKLIVTVENHSVVGGLGGLVSEVLGTEYPTRVIRIGVQDCYSETAEDPVLAEYHGIDAKGIVKTVAEVWEQNKK